MPTILGGGYEPVKVQNLDLVGYTDDGDFIILNPVKAHGRELPESPIQHTPLCLRTKVVNNQVVNFNGEEATLHDINGVWYYKLRTEGSPITQLRPHTFFEIGNIK